MFKNLNAQHLGDLTASGLTVTGGVGVAAPLAKLRLSISHRVVARTGKLPAGTCYVIAIALLSVATVTNTGSATSPRAHAYGEGGVLGHGGFTAAETAAVKVTSRAASSTAPTDLSRSTRASSRPQVLSSSHH